MKGLFLCLLGFFALVHGQIDKFQWKKCDKNGVSGPSFDVASVTMKAGEGLSVVGTPDAEIVDGEVVFNVRRSFFGFSQTTLVEREVDLCELTSCPLIENQQVTISRQAPTGRRLPPGNYKVTMEMYGTVVDDTAKNYLACVEIDFQVSSMSYILGTLFGSQERSLKDEGARDETQRYLKGTSAKYSKEKLEAMAAGVECNSKYCRQSPIDLISSAGVPIPMKLNGNGSFIDLSYLGEFLELRRGPNYLSYTLRKGFKPAILSINGQEFNLANIHFHTPSEHTIDGVRFPAEVHLVHEAVGSAGPASEGDSGGGRKKYAVIGVLLDDAGLSSNFDNLLGGLLADEGPLKKEGELDEYAKLGLDTSAKQRLKFKQEYLGGQLYYYPGSLTTPPYSSDVSWLVAAKPVSTKSSVVKGMRALGVENARPLQSSVGRSEVQKLVIST